MTIKVHPIFLMFIAAGFVYLVFRTVGWVFKIIEIDSKLKGGER